MSSKFHIELGQGTVSVEGEEEFVKAAFCALQSILTATEPAAEDKASQPATSKAQAPIPVTGQNTDQDTGRDTGELSAAEEFGNPGEILERIRDSLTSGQDEDDKEAVA